MQERTHYTVGGPLVSYLVIISLGRYLLHKPPINWKSVNQSFDLIWQEAENQDSTTFSKYRLEPPRDLRSQFLLSQQEKEKAREAAARMAQLKAEERAILEFEKPPPDPLWSK